MNDSLRVRTDEAPRPQREVPDLFETTNRVQAAESNTETDDPVLTAGTWRHNTIPQPVLRLLHTCITVFIFPQTEQPLL